MKLSGYKIKALFIKDMKNLMRNPNAAFMVLMPVAFAIFYSFILGDQETGGNAGFFVFTLCTLLNMGVTPVSVVGMSIAEEKEKNTLRTLMLSNVSAVEFMFAKLLVGITLFLIVNLAISFITGIAIASLPWYMLVALITAISALMFGAVVGLVSKDQMSTGYYGTPVMLLFMAPLFGATNDGIGAITKFIPTQSMLYLQQISGINELFSGDGLFAIGVIVVWIIASIFIFRFVYKKNSLDN